MKTRLFHLISALVLWTFASPAVGAELSPQEWTKLMSRLSDKGITRVGDFDISEFQDRVKNEVRWQTLSGQDRPEFTEGRRSAFFVIENKTVSIAPQLPAFTKDSLPHLETHEALGALNFNDRHYEMSTALEMLSRIKSPEDRKKLIDIFGKTIFNKENMQNNQRSGNGSGSGVGGGGDLVALSAKNQVLALILGGKEPVLMDFLKTYPLINFEPQYNPKEQYVSLKYQYVGHELQGTGEELPGVLRDPKYGYQELISIWIPVRTWESGGAARKKLLQDLKTRILELFPAYKSTKMRTFEHSTCKAKIRFPQPSFIETQVVQELRASVNQGCDALFPSYSVTTPSFDEDFRIKSAKPTPLKYVCELSEGKDVYSRQELIPELGEENGQTYATMLSDYSVLIGGVTWRADGSLNEMYVFNNAGEKKSKLPTLKVTAKKSVVKTKGVSGKIVSFGCKVAR